MNKLKVCVIIPAYNEEKAIAKVVDGIIEEMRNKFSRFIILVVNDKSTDQTSREARKSGAVVIDHILNTGAGGATATGLEYAKKFDYDLAVTMDGDGQHLSQDALNGLEIAIKQETDLLIGSRLMIDGEMSRLKVIGNKGLSIITNILFGVKSTDSQSGLRVFSKKAIINLRWKSTGFEFCSEMIWRAKQQKLIVSEYPIKAIYTDYSRSKGQSNWNAIHIIKNMLKHRFMEIFR